MGAPAELELFADVGAQPGEMFGSETLLGPLDGHVTRRDAIRPFEKFAGG